MTAVAEPTKKKTAKKANPNAKPGAADFDWAAQYPDEEVFVFTASDGTTVGLTAAQGERRLRPGDFRKMMHLEDWEKNFYLIEKVASPAALAVSDHFDDQDWADMVQAWSDWSQSSLGES